MKCKPIKIVRFHSSSNAIYIGRGSPYGNPYPITDVDDRDSVCDKYEKYFYKAIETDAELFAAVKKLYFQWKEQGELELGCFCAPARCHGETIKKYLEENIDLFENS